MPIAIKAKGQSASNIGPDQSEMPEIIAAGEGKVANVVVKNISVVLWHKWRKESHTASTD